MDNESEDRRTRILRLSADLFAARGYHATGLTDLLEEIGVARGGFYHHFKSKEEVLLEIVAGTIDRILLSSAAIVGQDLDAATRLRMLCDDLSQAIIDNQAGFVVFLREYSALGKDAKEHVLGLRRSYLERWEGVLEEGQRAGIFAGRETPYTEGILGMWIYSFVWHRDAVEPQTIAADLADFVVRGMSAAAHYPPTTTERAPRGLRPGRGVSPARQPKRNSEVASPASATAGEGEP